MFSFLQEQQIIPQAQGRLLIKGKYDFSLGLDNTLGFSFSLIRHHNNISHAYLFGTIVQFIVD
jgi:hypothetical protein